MSLQNIHLLFKRLANNDHEAYESVYQHYYTSLFSVAMVYGRHRELAEDAVQQVFLKLWERRDNMRNIEDPEAWLHTAARYQVMNMLDKEFIRLRHLQKSREQTAEEITSVDPLIIQQQDEIIAMAVNSLPEKQKLIYSLGREQGLTYAEIAAQMGLSRETIKDYMAQALKSLREALLRQKDQFITLFLILLKNIL